MNLISTQKNFIFLHIPKTGGCSIENVLKEYCSNDDIKKTHGKGHDKLSDIKKVVSEDFFNKSFKFAVVRNPYERMVSGYFYMKSTRGYNFTKTFRDFVCGGIIKNKIKFEDRTFKNMTFLNNKIGVDYVCRFENLDKDFSVVCNEIGINKSLPKINVFDGRLGNWYQDHNKHYSYYYTDETKKVVEDICRFELEYFKYKFIKK